jgi:predicted hydrocarbon binding protein
MPEIKKAGYYYPNQFARITLEAMQEVMGENGLKGILQIAGLNQLIGNFPPYNLEKEFDFADYTAINVAFDEMFGPRGARGLLLRAGRAMFPIFIRPFNAHGGEPFQGMPLNAKLKIFVPDMANIYSQFSDQISNVYDDGDNKIIYTLERCPMCWERKTDHAVCFLGQGFLQEALRWVSSGSEFKVDLDTCIAKGDDMGRYIIYKEPIS